MPSYNINLYVIYLILIDRNGYSVLISNIYEINETSLKRTVYFLKGELIGLFRRAMATLVPGR